MSQVFLVYDCFSPTEVSSTTLDSVFVNREDAESRVKAIVDGVKGYHSAEIRTATVWHDYGAFLCEAQEALRKNALAKLSAEERAALGLRAACVGGDSGFVG